MNRHNDDYTAAFVAKLKATLNTSNDLGKLREAGVLAFEILEDKIRGLPAGSRASYIQSRLLRCAREDSRETPALLFECLLRELALEYGLSGGETPETFMARKRSSWE